MNETVKSRIEANKIKWDTRSQVVPASGAILWTTERNTHPHGSFVIIFIKCINQKRHIYIFLYEYFYVM